MGKLVGRQLGGWMGGWIYGWIERQINNRQMMDYRDRRISSNNMNFCQTFLIKLLSHPLSHSTDFPSGLVGRTGVQS